MSRSPSVVLLLVLAATSGCRKRELGTAGAAAHASASAAPLPGQAVVLASAADRARLPEDPAAGQRSLAQWREHMAEEERERKLNYDKRKLREHRTLIAALKRTRDGYDSARSRDAVLAKQKAFSAELTGVRQRVEAIDRWGVNSNLLADYAALLALLSESYPAARLAALSGDRQRLDALGVEFDAHVKKMVEWLARAEEAEEE